MNRAFVKKRHNEDNENLRKTDRKYSWHWDVLISEKQKLEHAMPLYENHK
jgi:hypothetical protein